MTFALTAGPSMSAGMSAAGIPTTAPHASAAPMCPSIIICGSPVTNLMSKRTSSLGTPTQDLVPSACLFYKGAPAVTMNSAVLQDGASASHVAPDQTKVMILR